LIGNINKLHSEGIISSYCVDRPSIQFPNKDYVKQSRIDVFAFVTNMKIVRSYFFDR